MPMPNFLIIGAAKAGTTSVYRYLGQHPDIYLSPVKEPAFFSAHSEVLPMIKRRQPVIDDPDAYMALFNGAASQARAIGEASTIYLSDPSAAESIRRYAPEMKLIVMLRNPIDRLYSQYWMAVRDKTERRPIASMIDVELASPSISPVGYLGSGLYAKQLRPYLQRFGRSQIAIRMFEELCSDPASLALDLLRFLGIDVDEFSPDVSIRYNASGQPPHRVLRPLLGKSMITRAIRAALPTCIAIRAADVQERWRNRALAKPPLPAAQRKRLADFYRADVAELQDMIGRDLSGWQR